VVYSTNNNAFFSETYLRNFACQRIVYAVNKKAFITPNIDIPWLRAECYVVHGRCNLGHVEILDYLRFKLV
jgi:hypothetical protein